MKSHVTNTQALVLLTAAPLALLSLSTTTRAQAHDPVFYEPIEWPSAAPADCPFELSDELRDITFTGRSRAYTNADCWFPSWASDGAMYSSFSDGKAEFVGPDGERDAIQSLGARGPVCSIGFGKIVGDDPLDLEVIGLGTVPTVAAPYDSRYPSGNLVHDGIWYYGSHTEGHGGGFVRLEDKPRHPWAWVGPLVGFRISRDFGKTWTETPNDPLKPLFPELEFDDEGLPKYGPIQIGEPWFVDFGKNLEHSPDGKAYLTAHGATEWGEDRQQVKSSWNIGDQAFLLRVVPSPETINDADAYEFFAGHDEGGAPIWTKERAEMRPLLTWNGRVGSAAMTYNPRLEKYLFCISDGRAAYGRYDTYILESDAITGPFELVTYMESFGEQAYFVNIPSKFIGEDGRTAWLCYAANYSAGGENLASLVPNPPGSYYAMNLHEFRLGEPE